LPLKAYNIPPHHASTILKCGDSMASQFALGEWRSKISDEPDSGVALALRANQFEPQA